RTSARCSATPTARSTPTRTEIARHASSAVGQLEPSTSAASADPSRHARCFFVVGDARRSPSRKEPIMSLGLYVRPRLVVLGPRVPVFEAARAIENNNIGAVVVQDKGEVVGIVTDRDLAVRVVGRGLDPKTTPIADVMASPVATLSPSDSQLDAVRLMHERNIRRIPLVDRGRLVGIVTLDDLLIDEAAPIDELASVVAAQIGEGGPTAPVRTRAAARSAGRA